MRVFKAIATVLAVSLLPLGGALGQGWRDHGRGAERGGGRGGYAGSPFRPGGGAPAPSRYPHGGGYAPDAPYAPQGYARPGPRGYVRPEMGGYPAYPPAVETPVPRGGWRRGEFLPPGPAGGQTLDPRRYRLRSPPPGYAWRGVGRDAYLVQRSTGLILDTAPGAW